MKASTTSEPTYVKCGYCGNYHNYSYEMCRDMHRYPQPTSNPLKAIDQLSDEIGLTHKDAEGIIE